MPRIPLITAQESVKTRMPDSFAGSEAFGSQIGKAQQGFGREVQGIGDQFMTMAAQENKKREAEDVANQVAQSDYTQRFLGRQTQAPAGGKGFYEDTAKDYSAWVDERTKDLTNPTVRRETKERLLSQQPGWLAKSAGYEQTSQQTLAQQNAESSLSSLENKVRADPSQFELALQQGKEVVLSSAALPADTKNAAVQTWGERLARRRFENMLSNAKTTEEIDGAVADLQNPEKNWQNYIKPTDFDRLLDGAKTARTSIVTKADAQARATLTGIEERTNKLERVDPQELLIAEQQAKDSSNPTLLWKLAEQRAKQETLAREGKLPGGVLRERIAAANGKDTVNFPNLPAEANGAINQAVAATGGQISATYLGQTLRREYGGLIKKEDGQTDWGQGTAGGTSSAAGAFQFIRGTWLSTLRANGGQVAKLIGFSDADLGSDDKLLSKRGDLNASTTAAAFLALRTKQAMEGAIGRPVDEAEMYMGHFLGAGGATTLLRALKANPGGSAVDAVGGDAANANKSVFYKDGKPLTVSQVYNNISASFASSPGRVAAAQNETRQSILKDQETAMKTDPMSYGIKTGIVSSGKLETAQDFAQRGNAARQVADYFSVANPDMKPLTQDETATLSKRMQEGGAEEKLNIMSAIRGMGADMARAAYKQLGETDAVFEHAATLGMEPGGQQVAADIIRGQNRLTENKDIKGSLGIKDNDVTTTFDGMAGPGGIAFNYMTPRNKQSAMDAALAHYVERMAISGKATSGFKPDEYKKSVEAVMGTKIENVNGSPMVLPPGMDGTTFDRALDKLGVPDYIAMSRDGMQPRYADGTPIDPGEIAREGKFRYKGNGEYLIQMADDKYAIAQKAMDGRSLLPYVFKPQVDRLKEATNRKFGESTTSIVNSAAAAQAGAVDGVTAQGAPVVQMPSFDSVLDRPR